MKFNNLFKQWKDKMTEAGTWNAKCIFLIGSAVLLIYQVALIVFANLTQLQYHLGFDASSAYVHAMEMWKTKSMIPSTFALTTTLGWDSPDPLAALMYGLTNNIFLSFGIANIIFLAILCLVFYLILKELNTKPLYILLAFNFLLCPLLMLDNVNDNNLSYFAMILAEQGSYTFKIISILLLLLAVMKLERHKKCYITIVLATAMNIITSISSGLYVAITILIPCILYYVIKVLYKNKISKATLYGLGFTLVEIILSFASKTFAVNHIGFASRDSELFLTGILDFWTNLGAMILGYGRLVGGITLYSNILIFSKHGILQLVSVCIMIITVFLVIVAIVMIVKKVQKKEADILHAIPHCVALFNIMVFVLSNTIYDSGLFECRYLIIVYLMFLLISSRTLQEMPEKQLYSHFLVGVLIIGLFIQTTGMFQGYYSDRIEYDDIKELQNQVDDMDVPIAYVWGDSFLVTGRNLRPLDTSVIYKIIDNPDNPNAINHFGDYIYYDENALWQGKTALITTPGEYWTLPEYLRNHYVYRSSVGRFELYEAQDNPFDLKLYQEDSDKNFNYMYTYGMQMTNGTFDNEGNYISNTTASDIMNMTIPDIKAGTYQISLNYEILSGSNKDLPVLTVQDQNGNVLAQTNLNADKQQVTLDQVEITEDMTQFTAKCVNSEGTVVKLKSIEFNLIK